MKRTFLVVALVIFALTTTVLAGPPTVVWNVTYESGGNDQGFGVATDAAGNIYVTGYYGDLGTVAACRTIKYDSEGNVLWNKLYDEDAVDAGYSVAVDGAGNVYVAGLTFNGANDDFLTVKYDKDGNVLWSDVRDENFNDRAYAGVAIDPSGGVYVGGGSEDDGGLDVDFFAVKYDTDGNFLWKKRFGDDDLNFARGIAADQFFVYLTGITYNGVDGDFLTIRYDKEGNFGWEKDFDSGDEDVAFGVAVDPSHNVCVTGSHLEGTDYDFRTIKYAQDDVPAVEEESATSPLALEVCGNLTTTPTLRYVIPAGSSGTLAFYSADGRKVEEFTLSPSQSTFTWDASGIASGVYFVSLTAGTLKATERTIVIR